MHLDPVLPTVVGVVLLVLLAGLLLRALRQPYITAYLLGGVVLGPHGIALIEDIALIERLGAFGVMLILFFVGMEVSPRDLAKNWRVPVIGTGLQVAIGVGALALAGRALGWALPQILLLAFVVSLSSTAVVLKVLGDRGELDGPVGRDALGILLAQDIAVIPMMIVVGLFSGASESPAVIASQVIGALALVALFVFLARRDHVRLPLSEWLGSDPEIQVLAALAIFSGLSLLSGLAHLSSALGAFAGGMVVGAAQEEEWVHERLDPFRVVFVALFFVSVGMLVDPAYVLAHAGLLAGLITGTIVLNACINTLALRFLGRSWRQSLYTGVILSQMGEFGFLLAAVGAGSGIIEREIHELAVTAIALSLLVSPALIGFAGALLRPSLPATRGQGAP